MKATSATADEGVFQAIDRSLATIEFSPDGTIVRVNQNFSAAVGYDPAEIVGKHHRVFCDPEYAQTEEYVQFWQRLGAGAFEGGEYKRIRKDGSVLWLQATYNPVFDDAGTVVRVIKFASDITADKVRTLDYEGKVAAIDRAQAVIEFDLGGRIQQVNQLFCDTMGYAAAEMIGKHHRMFCEPDYVTSPAYAQFWESLAAGEFQAGEFRRIAKDGKDVWLQAIYSPILGADGKPHKVVKFASDVTAAKQATAEYLGKVAAMDRAQAVIEFTLDGIIIAANDNFCEAMGYRLAEIKGKHHRMFTAPEVAQSQEYADFWGRLATGEFESGEYKRVKRGGEEIWLQATYNPIFDADGKPFKVIKFASDVSAAKLRNAEIEARINAVDASQAVIEFDLDGYVLTANENFLRTMGYSLREIVGQHHSRFCSDDYKQSAEYRDFWLRLGKGNSVAGRFHRRGNYGRDVYIQATYTPVLDLAGRPFKVVKYAFDITEQVEKEKKVAQGARDMSTTVGNLASSIDNISKSSRTATDLAKETQGNAEQGVEALRASLEAIALIQRSSTSISDIVRVMGEIANQTNLLAFNASIEAARAGEHGIGFSIVAGEVRKLAERSFEAAQEIGKLIEESAERVDQGAEVSKRAENAFERIAGSVARTTEAIQTISDSTRVQEAASKEVDALISELATVDVSSR
nr:PAS domain-containing methyl-accepting chemotaxis protein [Modestobacter marinus]